MAKDNPEALETLRQQMSAQLIESAPQSYQRRLHGLQFQIDAQRQSSANPVDAMSKMYSMMFDSVDALNTSLNGEAGLNTVLQQQPVPQPLKLVNGDEGLLRINAINNSDISSRSDSSSIGAVSETLSADILPFKR